MTNTVSRTKENRKQQRKNMLGLSRTKNIISILFNKYIFNNDIRITMQ